MSDITLTMSYLLAAWIPLFLLVKATAASIHDSSLSEISGYRDAFRSPFGLSSTHDDRPASTDDFVADPRLPRTERDPLHFDTLPSNPFRRYLDDDDVDHSSSSLLSSSLLSGSADADDSQPPSTRGSLWMPSSTARRTTRPPFLRVTADLPHHWFAHDDDDDDDDSRNQRRRLPPSLVAPPRLKKTGTTIAGICGDGFCVIGADTRATQGGGSGSTLVADRRAAKLHWLTQNVVAAGAGTQADLQHLCRQTAVALAMLYNVPVGNSNLAIDLPSSSSSSSSSSSTTSTTTTPPPHYLARAVRVQTVCRMLQDSLFQSGGNVQAYLIVGGVDADTGKATLCSLHPHGSMDAPQAYAALGSGGYAAMGVLESRHRPDLTVDEAVALVRDCIAAGIANDMGSGSQIDVCVMSSSSSSQEETVRYLRSPMLQPSVAVHDDQDGSETSQATRPGINGFGGEPIVIRRTKTLYDPSQRESHKQTWRDFLGLD